MVCITRMATNPLDTLDHRSIRALSLLLDGRSVTAVARAMRTTQPTMSRLLGRLRTAFGDPLVVSDGRALAPTARGRSLRPRVASALEALEALATEPADDEPAHRFSIAASDHAFQVVVAPFLASPFAARARLEFHPMGLATIAALGRGEVDVAIGPKVASRSLAGLVSRSLTTDAHVVVMRAQHPLAHRALTKRLYMAAEHVVVRTELAGRSAVDRALGRAERTIRYRVTSLSHAVATIRSTDAIGTMPERFVRIVAPDLVVRPPPFPIAEQLLQVAFAPRFTNDPRHRSLRDALVRVAGEEVPRS